MLHKLNEDIVLYFQYFFFLVFCYDPNHIELSQSTCIFKFLCTQNNIKYANVQLGKEGIIAPCHLIQCNLMKSNPSTPFMTECKVSELKKANLLLI